MIQHLSKFCDNGRGFHTFAPCRCKCSPRWSVHFRESCVLDELECEKTHHARGDQRRNKSSLTESGAPYHGEGRRHDGMDGHSKVKHGVKDNKCDGVHNQMPQILPTLRARHFLPRETSPRPRKSSPRRSRHKRLIFAHVAVALAADDAPRQDVWGELFMQFLDSIVI